MKIGIITDIHGNLEALKAVLFELKNEHCDEIISLGDAIAIGPKPKAVLDLLIDEEVTMIKGNHEAYYLMTEEELKENILSEGEVNHQLWVQHVLKDQYKLMLQKLPYQITRMIHGKQVVFMHYAMIDDWFKNFVDEPDADTLYQMFDEDVQLVFYGHHHPAYELYDANREIHYINPGSLGCSKDAYARYVILDINENTYKIYKKWVSYDKEKTLKALDEEEVPERGFIKKIFF